MIGDVALVPAVIAQSGCHPLSCFAFFATSVCFAFAFVLFAAYVNACSVMQLYVLCFAFGVLCILCKCT